MIIFLSDLQKDHLALLHQHSAQVLVDFCKLAIDYLNNGRNCKKYSIAADKLNVDMSQIQNLVEALAYLVVEGSKYNLSDADFKSSLALGGFPVDHQEVLLKLYNNKKTELSSALCLLRQKDPSYQDFTWRFEIQVASRSSDYEVKPMVAMDFILMTPKSFSSSERDRHTINERKCISPINVNTYIQDAKAASHCLNVINHVLVQCDIPNLIYLTSKLEQALKESKSLHVRNISRVL